MTHNLFNLCLFSILILLTAPVQASEFFQGLTDIPVMPGLTQEPEQAVIFDTPGGRVVQAQAYAMDGLSGTDILSFYKAALPQLGWAGQGTERYVRDGERLDIEAFEAGGLWAVRLTLAPL